MRRWRWRNVLLWAVPAAVVLWVSAPVLAVDFFQRFPRPQFESGYIEPAATTPPARALWLEAADVAVLAAALTLATWLVLKRRSRSGLAALAVFSIAYFGFFRKGCVCPVGSIQNVCAALTDSSLVLPWGVLAFFLLPLVFALFTGRVFCSGVCPLGAIQDVVAWKPVRLPAGLAALLETVPVVFLGLAVLLALTGAGFVICKVDPFIGFYRMDGPPWMLMTGVAVLVMGIFVARPYCRFLCPYGVLLKGVSKLAARHAEITPKECVNCRLCESSCPFDCIEPSTPEKDPEPRKAARRRLGMTIALVPVLIVAGGMAMSSLHVSLGRMHPTVSLAERIQMEDRGQVTGMTLESEAFRGTGKPVAELMAEAQSILGLMRRNAWIAGCLVGLVIGLRLVAFSVRPVREEYVIDRGRCFSCGRCFEFCPVHHQWRQESASAGNSRTTGGSGS